MRPSKETGATTVFVMLMSVAMLVAAGLVIDGGYALAERRELTNAAEQAARVGADALDQGSLRDGGSPTVDPNRARAAASNYLSQTGSPAASITINGGEVTVTITSSAKTSILSIAGINSIAVTGTGAAESINENTP